MGRLYQQGLAALLDDPVTGGRDPLPTDTANQWTRYLQEKGGAQLSFLMEEPPDRLALMGLTPLRSQIALTLHGLLYPQSVPTCHDWDDILSIQLRLLNEHVCPLEPGPMAAWLREVRDTLTRPTADPRTASQVALVLAVLAIVTRDPVFRSQGWLGGSPDALALRLAVTDLMMNMHRIVERCPGIDDAGRERLQALAVLVQL